MKYLLLACILVVEVYAKGGYKTDGSILVPIGIISAFIAFKIITSNKKFIKSRWGKWFLYLVASPILIAIGIIGLIEQLPILLSKIKLKFNQFKYKYNKWKNT